MALPSSTLVSLCQCLGGKAPSNLDWMAVLELANNTLTTPFLIDLVDRPDQSVPRGCQSFRTRNLPAQRDSKRASEGSVGGGGRGS